MSRYIDQNVAKDRVIHTFPQAYTLACTPHTDKLDFHSTVRQACQQRKTGTVGLRVSKAVIVGDVSVGKTCLVNRFCHDIFDRDYKATIGVDFEVERFSVLGMPYNLQVWDTAGQERFKCIAASYYRGAEVLMVAFDLSDIKTLYNAERWMNDAIPTMNDPIRFLVGTKQDCVSTKTYKEVEKEAFKVAEDMNAEYWATSSKTGENVKEFFFRLTALTFNQGVLREINSTESGSKKIGNDFIKIDNKDDLYEKKKRKCCNT